VKGEGRDDRAVPTDQKGGRLVPRREEIDDSQKKKGRKIEGGRGADAAIIFGGGN